MGLGLGSIRPIYLGETDCIVAVSDSAEFLSIKYNVPVLTVLSKQLLVLFSIENCGLFWSHSSI